MYRDSDKEIVDLIFFETFGTLDEQQEQTLRDWIARSDDNLRMYEQIRSGESVRRYVRDFSEIQGAEIIGGIREALHIQARRRRRRLMAVSASAAACVLIVAMVAVFTSRKPKPDSVAAVVNAALLVTSDGKRIPLSEHEQDSKWQELIAAHEEPQVGLNAEPVMISVSVARGGKFRLELEDGTKVWLNEESRFEYSEHFGSVRQVALSGEAFFEVAKDSARVFTVLMDDGGRIDVLGTRFNVRNYADTPEIKVALIEGSVKVARYDESVILAPDHQAVIVRGESGISVDAAENVAEYMEWIFGRFEFDGVPLPDVIESLAKWYGMSADYDRRAIEKFGDVSFHSVKYEDCSRVLSSLSTLTGLKIEIAGNVIAVRAE